MFLEQCAFLERTEHNEVSSVRIGGRTSLGAVDARQHWQGVQALKSQG